MQTKPSVIKVTFVAVQLNLVLEETVRVRKQPILVFELKPELFNRRPTQACSLRDESSPVRDLWLLSRRRSVLIGRRKIFEKIVLRVTTVTDAG